jgi:hypothetical protein
MMNDSSHFRFDSFSNLSLPDGHCHVWAGIDPTHGALDYSRRNLTSDDLVAQARDLKDFDGIKSLEIGGCPVSPSPSSNLQDSTSQESHNDEFFFPTARLGLHRAQPV